MILEHPLFKKAISAPEEILSGHDLSIILTVRNNDRYRGHAVSALLEAAREVQYLPKSLSLVIFCEEKTLFPETSLHKLKEIFNYIKIFDINTQNTLNFTTKSFLCILDSSIFISKNYLREIFVTLQQKPQDTLLVPEFLIKYGLEAEILRIPELQNISPYVLVENIPFPPVFSCQSCLMTKIMAAGGLPSFDSARMLADAIAVGSIVERCNETAIFEHAASSNLSGFPPLPDSLLLRPEFYRRLLVTQDPTAHSHTSGPQPPHSPPQNTLHKILPPARAITQLVVPELIIDLPVKTENEPAPVIGRAYAELCSELSNSSYDEAFLLPFLTTGGADKYILDVINSLHALKPRCKTLVLFGEFFTKYAWMERLPTGANHVDLYNRFPDFTEDQRQILTLRIIQNMAPHGRLHIKGSIFSERFFLRFGDLLKHMSPIVYRFCDGRIEHGGRTFIDAGQFAFISTAIPNIQTLICDNAHIAAFDQQRIGASPEQWQVLYARMPTTKQVTHKEIKASGKSRRIIWASRIDQQKRPSLLLEIARLLQKYLPDMYIDVYGNFIIDNDGLREEIISEPNIKFHGGFQNFQQLDATHSFCFLYTSSFDGLPNVLLEAAASGIPLIAPNVGGVSEFVKDSHTGMLLDCSGQDDEDAELYIQAINILLKDKKLRLNLCKEAQILLEKQHAPSYYQQQINFLFADKMPIHQ